MIYKLLLTRECSQPVFTDHTSVVCGAPFEGVPLLRVSKQINEEASLVLYGSNKFHFVDNHGKRSSRRANDTSFMYYFLELVGKKNREQIQHLGIKINSHFVSYQRGELLAKERWYTSYATHMRSSYGKEIARAFELLSKGHNLKTVEIAFGGSYYCGFTMFCHFFRVMEDSLVIRALRNIRGVEELLVRDDANTPINPMFGAHLVCAGLKISVKGPKDRVTEQGAGASTGAKTGGKEEETSTGGKIEEPSIGSKIAARNGLQLRLDEVSERAEALKEQLNTIKHKPGNSGKEAMDKENQQVETLELRIQSLRDQAKRLGEKLGKIDKA